MNYKDEFSSITKASSHINDLLQSKGYIDLNDSKHSLNSKSLLFYSIDHERLTNFEKIESLINQYLEDEKLRNNNKDEHETYDKASRISEKIVKSFVLNENIINNDKNVINIIYSLLKAFDNEVEKKVEYDNLLKSKDQMIQSLKQENKALNTKLNHKLTQDVDKSIRFRMKIQELEETKVENSTVNVEIKKLKNVNKIMKFNHRIDLRKKDLEISKLKDKLLERKLSQSSAFYLSNKSDIIVTTNGRETPVKNKKMSEVEPLANAPVNRFSNNITPEIIRGFVDEEVEKLMVDSSDLITNLTVTNGSNLKLLNNSKNYLALLNDYLMLLITSFKSLFNTSDNTFPKIGFSTTDYVSLLEDLAVRKPPPAAKYFNEDFSEYDNNEAEENSTVNVTKTLTNLTSVGELQTQLMSNLDTMYSTISSLVHIPVNEKDHANFMGVNILEKNLFLPISLSNNGDIDSKEDYHKYTTGLETKIEQLKRELVETRQNWQRALELIEKWKQHGKSIPG